MVDHFEIGELGEGRVRRQGAGDVELDLLGVSLESVAAVDPDPLDHDVNQMFKLRKIRKLYLKSHGCILLCYVSILSSTSLGIQIKYLPIFCSRSPLSETSKRKNNRKYRNKKISYQCQENNYILQRCTENATT